MLINQSKDPSNECAQTKLIFNVKIEECKHSALSSCPLMSSSFIVQSFGGILITSVNIKGVRVYMSCTINEIMYFVKVKISCDRQLEFF